ncbi:MAG: hypothetical protein M5U15_13610 [Kiritimatiellae bacterium]|nr:hypothetical protein [Kiritimatiellia bacterium]
MIDFLRFGKKEAGPKVLRRIIEAERAAGLLPAEPPHPTPGETHAQGVHALETVAPADRVARGARRDDRLRAALRKVRLALDELEKALEG